MNKRNENNILNNIERERCFTAFTTDIFR